MCYILIGSANVSITMMQGDIGNIKVNLVFTSVYQLNRFYSYIWFCKWLHMVL